MSFQRVHPKDPLDEVRHPILVENPGEFCLGRIKLLSERRDFYSSHAQGQEMAGDGRGMT